MIISCATGSDSQVCCICQEKSVNPVVLPCDHVFCFLCMKGVAARQRRCALCRSAIPPGYVETPSLINRDEIKSKLEESQGTGTYHWFYEARGGGWWLYEQRASAEIEKVYSEGDRRTVRLQIAGFTYIIDFDDMVQYREGIPSRRRKIKRDVVKESVKGVAGICVRDVPSQRGGSAERNPLRSVGSGQTVDQSHSGREEEVVGGVPEEVNAESEDLQTLSSRLVTGFDH